MADGAFTTRRHLSAHATQLDTQGCAELVRAAALRAARLTRRFSS